MEIVFTSKFLLNLKTDISTPSHTLAPVRYVLESPRCQLSNGASRSLLASVSAESLAAIEMVFTSKSLLNLKTDISTSSHSLAPVRYVLDSPRCQLSNGTSHILLVSVSDKLQATVELVFTGEFLLTFTTDISTPSHSLVPVRHVLESPRCLLSNGTSHILLASVPAEPLAAMEMIFHSKSLLTLKTDILTSSHLLAPVRPVLESPRCLLSNGTSHILLASVSAKPQATIELVFIGEFLLTLRIDILMPSHLLTPIRHVLESPRCQISNSTSHGLLASVLLSYSPAIQIVFTSKFLQTLKTDISTLRYSLAPVRHVSESSQCQLSNGDSHNLLSCHQSPGGYSPLKN
ncbi:hypothetical protein L873DRAFT_1796049 [Choiromyces venosus 120613-1]|uniref:Uncharacterized protein n=1 Tax=Choiromyces venosus 120613-1 TaxID=1336337 RepID=A0A3N4IZ87_9PEZI|nr:hypothetical protein L873DRAFT_1796049 [Choiromyces venosus 120613-1]